MPLVFLSIQRNHTNVPSGSLLEYFKRTFAIPLLDSVLGQMTDLFSEDHHHAHSLLHLQPLLFCYNKQHFCNMISKGWSPQYEGGLMLWPHTPIKNCWICPCNVNFWHIDPQTLMSTPFALSNFVTLSLQKN